MQLGKILSGENYLRDMHTGYKNAGYKEGKRYYADMELVLKKTIKRYAGSFNVYLYMYPEYRLERSVTNITEEKVVKSYYDDSIEDMLGGSVDKLGG